MHAALGDGIDKIIAQQYLDFLTGRASRTSLLVAADRAAAILRAPDLDRLADLSLAGSFNRIVTERGAIGQGHITGQGGVVGLDDDISLQLLDSLGRVWPSPLTFEQLTQNIRDPGNYILLGIGDNADQKVKAALKALYPAAGQVLRLSMDPSPYQQAKNRNLRVIGAASYALQQTDPSPDKSCQIAPSNFWHDTVVLDIKSYERNWLQLFDGRTPFGSAARKAKAIWDELSPDALSSEIRAKFPQVFCAWIDRLRAQGLLTGSVSAWESFFQYAIRAHASQPDHAFGYVASLLMHVCPYQFGGLQTTHQPQAENSGSLPGELPRRELDQQRKALDRLIQAGKYQEATTLAEEATHKWPAEYQVWSNLTCLFLHRGTETGTLYPALRALALRPRLTQAYADLALGMWRSGKGFSLKWIVRQLLRINGQLAQCWDLLGQILEAGNNHGHEAELCSRRAVELAPGNIVYLSNLAGACSANMKNDDAEIFYHRAAALDPDSSWVLSNLLFTLAHKESVDPKELFGEHRRYGQLVQRRHGSARYHEYLNDRNPNRPLKVGFVSADLHAHVVSYFVEEIWKELDSSRIQIYVYSNTAHEDQVTARLKSHAHSWESIVGIDDSKVAENIHSNKIDVLVDLSGHTGNNRLPLFALKPAPVQISFIGYPGTTGLEEMDYRITYSTENLDITDQFTEKLMCLPYVFRFKDANAPEVNDLPALQNGYLTFASFNRPQKIGATIFDAWAHILHAAPRSKMLIANMDGQPMMDDFISRFEQLGISEERLLLRPRAEKGSYMLMHHEVDMMLDTFPYGGGTTINHACWMGVPSLTIKGKTAVGRYGTMINSQLDLREFIAGSIDEYVKSASVWAQKFNELAGIRRSLRARMCDSGMSGNGGAGHYLEKGIYAAWKRWCDGLGADHLIIQPD
jgi:tetratricopeptide (TPR) repeat protein